MRSFKFFILGFCFSFLSGIASAYAETIVSTAEFSIVDRPSIVSQPLQTYTAPTAAQLHALRLSLWPKYGSNGEVAHLDSNSLTPPGHSCITFHWVHSNGYVAPQEGGCADFSVQYSCPTGYTLSADGLSCSRPDCPPGTEHNSGGNCVTPCPPSGDTSHAGEFFYWNKTLGTPGGACVNGCGYNLSSGPAICIDNYCKKYMLDSRGESCGATDVVPITLYELPPDSSQQPNATPNDTAAPGTGDAQQAEPPASTQESCTASGQGYITMNGVTMCVPAGTGSETTEQGNTSSTNNPDGTKTETSETTTQNSDGTVTKTTTVTQKDSSGSVVGTPQTTSTNYSSQAGFCQQNPTASICTKNQASGGATCDVAPTCSGDPATCAILRQQWETRCQIKKQNDYTAPEFVQGSFPDLDQEIADKKQQVKDLVDSIKSEATQLISFNSGSGAGSLGCPAGPQILGQNVTLCFDTYSTELSGVGAVVVFVSLILALFIIFS